jgi:hypothetical protein
LRAYITILVAALLLVGCQRSSEKLTLIDGSCEQASSIGNLADYSIRVRAKSSDLGFIRIRSDASWSAEDTSNVLGKIPSGTVLWAQGPLKNAEHSNGIGYAVAIRDKDGRVGRGYVSFTIIEVLPKE